MAAEFNRPRNRPENDTLTNTNEAIDAEKKIQESIERFFHGQSMARLETQLPRVMKQDLNYLKDTIDPAGTGVKRTANRLIAEALVDLFKKYGAGNGDIKLNEKPDFKGKY